MTTETAESWPLVTGTPSGVSFEGVIVRWSPDGSFIVSGGYSQKFSRRAIEGVTYDAMVKLLAANR